MTEEQLRSKVKEYRYVAGSFDLEFDKRLNSLIKSNALRLEDYQNDYELAKIVTWAILKHIADYHQPYLNSGIKKGQKMTHDLFKMDMEELEKAIR